jgi:hypothetical protein
MRRGKTYTNKTKYRSVKYVIKEEKIQVFDRNLVQEMQKKNANKTSKGGGAGGIDNSLSTVIATGNDLEQNIELMEEAIQSAYRRSYHHSIRLIITARGNQSRGCRSD